MPEAKTFSPNAVALTLAGSDPSGGAGLQADLKTFQQFGVYGASAVTMLTVQNTLGVRRVEILAPDLVVDQIDAVLDDFNPIAAKTGALGNAALIDAVAQRAAKFQFPLIVDPVMVSKHGHSLIEDDAVDAYRRLLKHAFLVTPNRFELERLTGVSLDGPDAVARAIHDLHVMGARFVLAKMGNVDGQSEHILGSGTENFAVHSNRIDTHHTHGAGCVLSASITAMICLGQTDLKDIVHRAIRQVVIAIHNTHPIAKGQCPVETRVMENEPVELTN
ncbi:MAG: bifunctional hydroxymethylpyrimidine kinase/phosphomethylpyrimidine kinase [Planctomycetota bacterium]